MRLSGGVVFLPRGDGGIELGPSSPRNWQFLDVVLKRDHRPLLLFRRRGGRTVLIGPGQERLRRKAGRGEPILPRLTIKCALARSLRAAKIAGTAHPWAGPIGAVEWEATETVMGVRDPARIVPGGAMSPVPISRRSTCGRATRSG